MKAIFIAIMALVLLTPTMAGAKKQHHVPLPKPRTTVEDILARAQATNPDPFNVNRNQATPVPTPQPTPVVVTVPAPPAPPANDLRAWLHSALLTFLTGIAGWLGIKLPSTLKGNKGADQSNIKDVVESLVHGSVIKDPDLKAKVDLALYQAIQSGVPGQALQAGLGLIPGAAPFVTTLEPMLRKVVLDVLQERAKAVPPTTAEMPKAAPNIEDLLNNLAAKLANRPAEKVN